MTIKGYLDVRFIGEDSHLLLSDIIFVHDRFRIIIFKGLEWNGANIPKMLRWVDCPMTYALAYASLLHDALYGSGLLDRKTSDKLFYHALVNRGLDPIKAKVYYLAVRQGGEPFYKDMLKVSGYRSFIKIDIIN